jgi:Spy/CpxP family protein refolding chaperone
MIWVLFIIIPTLALAQSGHSPYAGQEQRALKALSPEEIEMYLEGHGMGLAKAAELNHYPGPKHVLELVKQLNLSATQLAQTQKAYDQMLAEAVRLGKLIVAKERALDSLYATEKIDPSQLRAVVGEIAKLQGELRVTHLSAHLEMKKILSPQQVAKYDELRGYGRGTAPQQHQHGKH